jgi:acetoin utilization protein AcuB
MRAQDLMTRNVATIDVNASADEARRVLKARKFHHLVVSRNGAVVGIVSSHDLGGTRAETSLTGRFVKDVMTPYAVTVDPRAPIRTVANVMRGRTVGCLPVVEDGKLVGIVTVTDLLTVIGRGLEKGFVKSERRVLRRRVPGGKPLTSPSRAGGRRR